MNHIRDYILFICNDCGRVLLTERHKEDPKGSVYCYSTCPDCVGDDYDSDKEYYGDEGLIDT